MCEKNDMSILSEVKSWMRFWGWTEQGGPGAVKQDIAGRAIARHGDQTWNADVDLAEKKAYAAKEARP